MIIGYIWYNKVFLKICQNSTFHWIDDNKHGVKGTKHVQKGPSGTKVPPDFAEFAPEFQ